MIIKIPLQTVPKKNSQQIAYNKYTKKRYIIQSDRYLKFARDCVKFLFLYKNNITYPINLKCTFYVADKRKRDLTNLMNSIADILVENNVLQDDNYNIIQSWDGTRIIYEKGRQETIIEILPII